MGFKFAYVGSSLDLVFKPKFQFPHQSVNYVECHDNSTLFDKLVIATPEDSERDILQRIKLINAINMIAFGVPFFHQGQEIDSVNLVILTLIKVGIKLINLPMLNWTIALKWPIISMN